MKKIRIAGVPEHFNFPWHMAMEESAFEDRGIEIEWIEVPEGTGRMCKMLEVKETDLAIILTEGITKSIVEGNPAKIVQGYISSPLLWGIHVAAGSAYQDLAELEGTKAAISRYGSGSHLMAYVLAEGQHWNTAELSFEVIHTLSGAVKALQNGKADYFMWEHFTTKPLVLDGVFRRLADCPTPWPCFVIAANNNFLEKDTQALRHVLEIINRYTREFKMIPSIDRTLANRYNLDLQDIRDWLGITQWTQEQLDIQTIDIVQNTLFNLNLISKQLDSKEILTNL
ncbi:substrate-binding domain-containing protein [uncultured Muriicola sp.]|uniref:substrate-binding domain-containing protein n=1 Tax=uncultured Muriicola sp. TaxID=1583102 RepID=UPI00262023D8|nr:substrate-binding domain-containing protein [uncultured Muriicola sp.]